MDTEQYKVSAPGSMMLMGEHAVLRGKYALVAALNRRMEVTLTPREDSKIFIDSEIGNLETNLDDFKVNKEFSFVTEVIASFLSDMKVGFKIEVRSNMPHDKGYGSSAAITAALIATFQLWLQKEINKEEVFHLGLKVIRAVQNGKGSGADLSASIFGGVLYFRSNPFFYEKLENEFNIVLVNSGKKVPTPEVIEFVAKLRDEEPDYYNELDKLINESVVEAARNLKSNNLDGFYEQIETNQSLMQDLGVSTEKLETLLSALRREKSLFAAKISGSGLGDCVYGIGEVSQEFEYEVDKVKTDINGVICL